MAISTLQPWLRLSGDKILLEKESLPVGSYRKDSDDLDFEISEDFIDKLVENHQSMIANGVKVPFQLTHNKDGEVLGTVVALEKKTNSEGKPSLFSRIEFNDEQAATEAQRHDVSVLVEPVFVDGKKNTYRGVLRHLAATGKPVIPGLAQWQSLAASEAAFVTEAELSLSAFDLVTHKKANPMLDKFAEVLKVTFEEGATDEAKETALLGAIDKLQNPVQLSFPEPVISRLQKARETEINALVPEHLTPAAAKEIASVFNTPEQISLSLSEDSDSATQFDSLIEALKKNKSVGLEGREDPDLVLSHIGNGEKSTLADSARKIAEAHKNR